jgi:hypothetical protein
MNVKMAQTMMIIIAAAIRHRSTMIGLSILFLLVIHIPISDDGLRLGGLLLFQHLSAAHCVACCVDPIIQLVRASTHPCQLHIDHHSGNVSLGERRNEQTTALQEDVPPCSYVGEVILRRTVRGVAILKNTLAYLS